MGSKQMVKEGEEGKKHFGLGGNNCDEGLMSLGLF